MLYAANGQKVVALEATSTDGGDTFAGTVTFGVTNPADFHAAWAHSNTYAVKVRLGDASASWSSAGTWLIGCRAGQKAVAVDVTSSDGGNSLRGSMTYAGEGPIDFRSTIIDGDVYAVQNQWGGPTAAWHDGGVWILGCRGNQKVVGVDVASNDAGMSLTGTMTYAGEGPIGFRATRVK